MYFAIKNVQIATTPDKLGVGMRKRVAKGWVDNGVRYTISWYASEHGVYSNNLLGKFESYARIKAITEFATNYRERKLK